MASFTFTGPGGANPIEYTLRLSKATRPTAGDVAYAAGRQKTRILQRNERGVDVNGSAFVAYSPKYAKKREKSGRNTEPVDLTFTGLMNKAMQVTINGAVGSSLSDLFGIEFASGEAVTNFALGFYGNEATRARAHNEGTARIRQRHFFDASEQDLQTMQSDIGAHIGLRIANL